MADEDELYEVVSEQRREIMTAISLDRDLELAYELQMKEGRKAPLAHEPSSSSRPPSQPNRENWLSPKDDDFKMARDLWLAELASFRPVVDDGERSEAEVINEMEDGSQQKRAKYIHNMPEGERMVNRDNYQSPYGSSSPEGKHCRLYVKGLLSEETVGDKKVMLAGAGIAICDLKDGLLWEESKTLEVQVDGQVVIDEVVKLMALIEGLNQVRALHLSRVKFFCDDDEVFRIIQASSEKEPQQSKIAALVNEVSLLQKKFTYCKTSLVSPNNMKYAYKSARDAIVSQVTQLEEANASKRLKETCVICIENIDVDNMFSVDGCLHRYCLSCMKKHVEVKLLAGMEAKCPHKGCNSKVSIDSCGKFLAPELVEIFSQKIKESSIPVTEKVYCPYPKCSTLMSKSEVLQYTKTSHDDLESEEVRKCVKCHCLFCIKCKVPWHTHMTCNQYKKSYTYSKSKDAELEDLRRAKRWPQCVKCNHVVELVEGCYHITCRCGYEFCYACCAEWKNRRPTCSCPRWNEHNIIRD